MCPGVPWTPEVGGTKIGSGTKDCDQEGGLQGHGLMVGVAVTVHLRKTIKQDPDEDSSWCECVREIKTSNVKSSLPEKRRRGRDECRTVQRRTCPLDVSPDLAGTPGGTRVKTHDVCLVTVV